MPVQHPNPARPTASARRPFAPLRAVEALLVAVALAAAAGGCSKSDLSSPMAAAKTFATALMDGDAETAKKASAGADAKVVEAMAATFGNLNKLQKAAVAKFGDAGKSLGKTGGPFGGDGVDDMRKAVDAGTEQVTGDTATVTMKTGKVLKLKKVDGSWKVDVSEMAGPAAGLAASLLEPMGKAAKEVADEINAGKYKTADEAAAALSKRFLLGG